MTTNYTFRELLGLTNTLRVVLYVGAGLAVIAVGSGLMQADMLRRGTFTEAEGQANDARERIIGLFQIGVFLLTTVVFGCWIVRANKNVRALGADGLRITPGWAVGYFFIPFLNLVRPYQAMQDLWRASRDPAAWKAGSAGSIVAIWWALWIISNVVGQMTLRATMDAEGVEDLRVATWASIASHAVDIPLCLVAAKLVAQIAAWQRGHAHRQIAPPPRTDGPTGD